MYNPSIAPFRYIMYYLYYSHHAISLYFADLEVPGGITDQTGVKVCLDYESPAGRQEESRTGQVQSCSVSTTSVWWMVVSGQLTRVTGPGESCQRSRSEFVHIVYSYS